MARNLLIGKLLLDLKSGDLVYIHFPLFAPRGQTGVPQSVPNWDGSWICHPPSEVELRVIGWATRHKLSVKKSRFKPWERTITVSTGQVNVSATLEPEGK